MRLYRPLSLVFMLLFAATGLLFLAFPGDVLGLFNSISSRFGMLQSPTDGLSFFLILAVGYMYVVTVLAFLMFRHPENRSFPLLLINAKLASSVLSLALFLMHEPYLIYMTNFVIDGLIGATVLFLYLKTRSVRWALS